MQTVAVQHGVHGVLGAPGIGLHRLFDLGTETWPRVYTEALRAMKALRLP